MLEDQQTPETKEVQEEEVHDTPEEPMGPDEEHEYSEEELAELREAQDKFYDDQLPLLRKQEEYHRLIADIEEHRTRRLTMIIRHAQMTAPPPEQGGPEEAPDQPQAPESSGRKLKED